MDRNGCGSGGEMTKKNYKVQGINNKTGKVRYLKIYETGKMRIDMVWKNLQDAKYALDVVMYQKWDDYDEQEWREWGNVLASPWGQKDEDFTWSIVRVEDASNCS